MKDKTWHAVQMKRVFLGFALSVAAVVSAGAGEADGFYKATKVDGHVTLAGQKMRLPIKALRTALLRNGLVVVKHNRIPVRTFRWSEVLEDFRFKGIDGEATASSPSNVVLHKAGRSFRGRAKRPLVVTQKGKYRKGWFSVSVKVRMSTNLATVIRPDGTLTMESPVSVSALGLTARGSIILKAKKQEVPNVPGL